MNKLSIFDISWEADTKKILIDLSVEAQSWILSCDSLTQSLKSLNSAFSLQLLKQDFMSYAGQSFFQRSVLLCMDNCPWIFASSLFSKQVLDAFPVSMNSLSDRPLGEILFSSSDIHHRESLYAVFQSDLILSQYVDDYQFTYDLPIYARKREFQLEKQPFWVSEFFLPPSINYLNAIKKLP